MSETGRKKRKSKHAIKITDEFIYPYYIIHERGGYSLHNESKTMNTFVGHYTSLENTLRRVSKLLFYPKSTSYHKLADYINEYNVYHKKVESLLKEVKI